MTLSLGRCSTRNKRERSANQAEQGRKVSRYDRYDYLVADGLERKRAQLALAAKIAVSYPVTTDYVDWCLTVADGDEAKVRQALDFTCRNGWGPLTQ